MTYGPIFLEPFMVIDILTKCMMASLGLAVGGAVNLLNSEMRREWKCEKNNKASFMRSSQSTKHAAL